MGRAMYWGTKPEVFCKAAKERAIEAFRKGSPKGLTSLERGFYEAIKSGRLPPDDPYFEFPTYQGF